MNITIFHKGRCGVRHLKPSCKQVYLAAFAVFIGLPTLTGMAAWKFAQHQYLQTGREQASAAWLEELEVQRQALADARANAEQQMNALTAKLGAVQAQAMRLDALGGRLTQMAGLEPAEFAFDAAPGFGGASPELARRLEVYDFIKQLDELSSDLSARDEQMGALETVLLTRTLADERRVAGAPVRTGYMSSAYGTRNDPFEGSQTWHEGIDFAGQEGSEVLATAGGIVVHAGPMSGYGNLVEISHGDGMTTRYGHNRSVTVQVGEIVRKGQAIATLGSTGRSTGPHVHYEVLKNGTPVNPHRYVNR